MQAAPAKLSDSEVAEAYRLALAHARKRAARFGDEVREVAHDAATDAVLWAVRKFDPAVSGNGFAAFAQAAVRVFVHRHIALHAQRHKSRPHVTALETDARDGGEWLADRRADGAAEASAVVLDLPDDLRHAVVMYLQHGFNLRECGLLLGCSMELVRQRLHRAAKLLVGEDVAERRRGTGEKRLRAR